MRRTFAIIAILVFGPQVLCGAEAPRRAPYKEVRTKHNQDPAVKEAIRVKLEKEHEARIEHRKKVEAQMGRTRFGGARPSTNSVSSTHAPVKAEKELGSQAPKPAPSADSKTK